MPTSQFRHDGSTKMLGTLERRDALGVAKGLEGLACLKGSDNGSNQFLHIHDAHSNGVSTPRSLMREGTPNR
jgi:hypothetical protein